MLAQFFFAKLIMTDEMGEMNIVRINTGSGTVGGRILP